jgi:hypothetical protein
VNAALIFYLAASATFLSESVCALLAVLNAPSASVKAEAAAL